MLGEVEDMFPSLEEGESRLCRRSLGVRRLEGEVGGGGKWGVARVAEARSYGQISEGIKFRALDFYWTRSDSSLSCDCRVSLSPATSSAISAGRVL